MFYLCFENSNGFQLMHKFRKIADIAGRLFLVIIFLGYYVGSTDFMHTHELDGQIIVHSHFYFPGANGQPAHSHSAAAFNTIAQLNLITGVAAHYMAPAMLLTLLAVFFFEGFSKIVRQSSSTLHLRAPPVA